MQGPFPFVIWAEGFGRKISGEPHFGGGLGFKKKKETAMSEGPVGFS